MRATSYASTLSDLAVELSTSTRRLYWLRGRGLKLTKTRDGYNVDRIRKWIERRAPRMQGRAAPAGGSNGLDRDDPRTAARLEILLDAQARSAAARASLQELALEEQEARLVPLEVVLRRDALRIGLIKSELLELPSPLAFDLEMRPHDEIETVLRKRFRELLTRFSQISGGTDGEEESEEEEESDTPGNRRRRPRGARRRKGRARRP